MLPRGPSPGFVVHTTTVRRDVPDLPTRAAELVRYLWGTAARVLSVDGRTVTFVGPDSPGVADDLRIHLEHGTGLPKARRRRRGR